ncbi:MAG: Holliday junction resolvase RuvX [Candidatus Tectomicrobia bacterium]|uniref:Putative pre-16S rRNA nuclease n=1 Tax=Tectimicrobiota bacterium TaxID=2528274 RepID=A0A932CL24_UNCTE|nr:Holliday junction resolvase RuvX [Candidatus Tectomicrobia bacterium]
MRKGKRFDGVIKRILGLDIGERYIGVAVSDPLGITAQGVETFVREGLSRDLHHLRGLIDRYQVEEIVLGLPVNMDGTRGPQAEKVEELAGILAQELGLPVSTWDERLSTVAADKLLISADMSRKKRKAVVNKLAAQMILQGYLDRLSFCRSAPPDPE